MVNFIIQELKFRKITKFFFVSLSFEKKNLRELGKSIFHKIQIFSEEQDENENIDKKKPTPIRTSTPEPIEVNVFQIPYLSLMNHRLSEISSMKKQSVESVAQ